MDYILFLITSLWLIPGFYYLLWKFLHRGNKRKALRKPTNHLLLIRQDGNRWQLYIDKNPNNNESPVVLAEPLRVIPKDTITYKFEPPITGTMHLQFPSDQIFKNFKGIDCYIPNPDNPLTFTVADNGRNAGSHKYSIVVTPHEPTTVSTPYVSAASPPEIILEHE